MAAVEAEQIASLTLSHPSLIILVLNRVCHKKKMEFSQFPM